MNSIIKNSITVFIILASITFLNIILVPASLIEILQLGALGICLLFMVIHNIYDTSFRIKKFFKTEIIMIFIAIALSMAGAYFIHGQSFKVTAIAQRSMYFLIFYFFLHSAKINPHRRVPSSCQPKSVPPAISFTVFVLIYYISEIYLPYKTFYNFKWYFFHVFSIYNLIVFNNLL